MYVPVPLLLQETRQTRFSEPSLRSVSRPKVGVQLEATARTASLQSSQNPGPPERGSGGWAGGHKNDRGYGVSCLCLFDWALGLGLGREPLVGIGSLGLRSSASDWGLS